MVTLSQWLAARKRGVLAFACRGFQFMIASPYLCVADISSQGGMERSLKAACNTYRGRMHAAKRMSLWLSLEWVLQSALVSYGS